MYAIREIIQSISSKPFRTGFTEAPSDTVEVRRYLNDLFGPTDIRTGLTNLPVGNLRILQATIEIWRYLRLCNLSEEEFGKLTRQQPLVVVRGKMVEAYPLLQGNHRVLYALQNNIESLPAEIYVIVDEDAAYRFQCACEQQYLSLDARYGCHTPQTLLLAYRSIVGKMLPLRQPPLQGRRSGSVGLRSRRFSEIRKRDMEISAQIPCISLRDYLHTIHALFGVQRDEIRVSGQLITFERLVMTQGSIEKEKLNRIAASKDLFDAPILLVRTRILDYVVAGHTRLRARLDAGLQEIQSIVLDINNDRLNGFLDAQAAQTDYLVGTNGIQSLALI